MTIKQRFELLDTFSLPLKHQVMLFIRQAEQVLGMVVVFDAIQVMNNPSFWQWLAMRFFPDKDVLTNISVSFSSWVVRFMNKDIPGTLYSTAFPIMVVFAIVRIRLHLAYRTEIYRIALWASFGKPSTNRLTAVKAEFRFNCSPRLVSASIASQGLPMNHPSTIFTRVLGGFLILYLSLIHIEIITHTHLNNKVKVIVYASDKLRQEMPRLSASFSLKQ